MANGLPTPKSREQILSEMLTEYVGLTGINDLNTGSVITQFFDVVSRSVARTSGDIFQVLRDFSVERATGEALNRIGREERVYRNTAQVASGIIKVTDSSFEKISTKIYSGSPAPNIGTSVIKVSDASNWPISGRLYIGRGTPNIEGPIQYSSVNQVGAFWEITLDSPTTKFHNISESVILGQGGTRNVPVNTVVLSPGAGATPSVNYSVSSAALLLDGENINANVQVTAQEPGSFGNAPAGSITEFSTAPFPGAIVINEIPFTTGSDEESDDDYRDRIKKERLSRGLGTALAVKNAVLGIQAADENARVTSNEIDTTNPEQTILYIDNGEGYEEKTQGVGLEFVVDSAIGGEQNFQLQTGGRQTSIAKAFLESSISSPYNIRSLNRLSVLIGGIISEHIFPQGSFKAEGAATAFEVVSSINDNPDLTFEATTSENGTKVIIRAKAEDNEFLQITSPTSGVDAAPALGFPSNESATVLLYKNRELLNKNGRSAFVVTQNQFSWSTSVANGDTLIISVDGTDYVTYTFRNEDFISEGTYSTVSPQNSLTSWANVINKKVTGVTAEVNGEQLKITSNLGAKNRASISIDPSCDMVAKGIFSSKLGLESQGNEADFELSRNTAQIKLNKPLSKGDSLNLGSELTRAEIQSNIILGGQTTLPDTSYVWFVVDDPNVEPVEVGVTSDTYINVSKPGNGIIRYESTSPNSFGNVEIGDYVIVWSTDLLEENRLEGRVNGVYGEEHTILDLRVTSDEESAVIPEGPIFFTEGFTVVRTKYTPQKVRINTGVYDINDIAVIIDQQLKNATATVDNDEIFIFRTNTESKKGCIFIADFNDPAKALNLVKNSKSTSINSQIAFYETEFSDKQFPAFVHGKITANSYADPINTYISTVKIDENLSSFNLDPSGWICFNQPYGGPDDVQSTECVEIEKYLGTTISVEKSYFYKRSRINDRFHIVNPYDFGHDDSLVVVLDDDPTAKTFNIPLYRTAVTNIGLTANPNNFRAYDKEGGTVEFTEFFGFDFSFDNYKLLMQAKNVVDPLSSLNDDAILYRSVEWGRSGEKFGVGYFYPTSPNQEISHIVDVGEFVNIKLFLKSGPSRVTTINGTTEWNITIIPESPTVDLVTYAWTGVGNNPDLSSVNSGDYVSIINTGEFSTANQGSFKIYSKDATSFTVKRALGTAEEQLNVATLETTSISFFESADTTAQEIVEYTNQNISSYITAQLVQDGTTAIDGSGLIIKSTGEDSNFDYEYVRFKDGKNYILSSNINASTSDPQFILKTPLELYSFNTNTNNAYSFNKGEELRLIPQTSIQITDFFNVLAVTGFTTLGQIKSINRNSNIQFSTNTLGSEGAIELAGGTANSSIAAIEGSSSSLGSQSNQKSIINILNATSAGFHSDQWVRVFASEKQKKTTGINNLNTLKISGADPVVGYSKIEIFNKNISQRFFGRNRYHTRTRNKTFRIEKQGQFTCISWDGNGTEPYFVKNIDLNDIDTKNVAVSFDSQTSIANYNIISGSISFEEVAVGDMVYITGFSQEGNNGTFKVLGVSEDGKTLRVRNPNAVNTAGNVNEVQSLTFDAVPSTGNFSLNFDGEITAPISYNATSGDIETALEDLSNITDVNVVGDFSTGFQIEFAGVNANTDVSNLIVETNTLDVAINEFEQFDFSGITGFELDDISQVEELDFTAVTAANLDATNQIEQFDFTVQNLSGSTMDATQQIEQFDYLGLIGSDFDTITTKAIQLAGNYAYIWYNVTDGLNIQSDPSLTGTSIQVDILSSDDDVAIASKTKAAYDLLAPIIGISNISINTSSLTVTYDSGDISDSTDNATGIQIAVIQQGIAAKSFELAGNYAYIWYNVTDSLNVQTDPGGNGVGIQVDVLLADDDGVLANRTALAITAVLPITGILSASDSAGILNVNYSGGNISNGTDVTAGIDCSVIQNGINSKSFQLGGNYAYLWFNVTDGTAIQSDSGGNGTGIQVDILTTDDVIAIAGKAATAIDTAAGLIVGLKSASNVDEIVTLNYEVGNISNSFDIDSEVTSTEIENGYSAKSIQLAENSAYIWFNVVDGENIQSNPGGNGIGIKVDILLADIANNIATKAALAIINTLPISPIFNTIPNANNLQVYYDFTPSVFGSDISAGVIYNYIENQTNQITITEEVKGSISGDFSVTTEIQEGDSVIINSDFSILNQGIYRIIRRFKNSFYIDNQNSIEEEITIGNNRLEIIKNNEIAPRLIFTNGIDQVVSEENQAWTSFVAEDYFIKVSSEGDDKYYKILSIDNPYTVTLTSTFNEDTITTNAVYVSGEFENTTYNITKHNSFNKIEWSGSGLEPHFENSKSGDIITLGNDFSTENRGDFHIIESGVKLQEITQMEMARGLDIISGNYCKIYTVDDTSPFHLGYKVTTNGIPGIDVPSAPIPSRTIQVEIDSTDSATVVAEKTALILNNTPFDEYFSVEVVDNVLIITNILYGPVDNFENVDINGEFSIETLQQGRRNFVSYINVKGISESSVSIVNDKIELHREAIQFKDYDGTVPGDTFVISDPFLGENNIGSYIVNEVLSDYEIVVSGNMDDQDLTLLDSNFNKVYIQENLAYVGYKQIEFTAINPSNLNNKNIIFTTSNQFDKINEIAGTSISAVGKMALPDEIVRGVDSYKFHTGLIAEANRTVYGDPRDNTTYPGVSAAGSEIFIKAPLVRRVEVSIDVRIKTGVPFSVIVTEVRNSIAALINSNPVGQPISISSIISNVDSIVGVQAVAISSPAYDPQNDVIRINAGEKALVLDSIADILVSKID